MGHAVSSWQLACRPQIDLSVKWRSYCEASGHLSPEPGADTVVWALPAAVILLMGD